MHESLSLRLPASLTGAGVTSQANTFGRVLSSKSAGFQNHSIKTIIKTDEITPKSNDNCEISDEIPSL